MTRFEYVAYAAEPHIALNGEAPDAPICLWVDDDERRADNLCLVFEDAECFRRWWRGLTSSVREAVLAL